MKTAIFVAPEFNRLSSACATCNVRIHSHTLNEQQEQITLLEEGKLWFSPLSGEGLEPIELPWKSHCGHNFVITVTTVQFQFYVEKVVRDIQFCDLRVSRKLRPRKLRPKT